MAIRAIELTSVLIYAKVTVVRKLLACSRGTSAVLEDDQVVLIFLGSFLRRSPQTFQPHQSLPVPDPGNTRAHADDCYLIHR